MAIHGSDPAESGNQSTPKAEPLELRKVNCNGSHFASAMLYFKEKEIAHITVSNRALTIWGRKPYEYPEESFVGYEVTLLSKPKPKPQKTRWIVGKE
jgi:hypothetical protein